MIIKNLKQHYKKIITVYILATGLITGGLLYLDNLYTSQTTLIPASIGANPKIGGQIGGLAKLAGVDIGSQTDDKSKLALRILKSRDFTLKFIEDYDLKPLILGNPKWDSIKNTVVPDDSIFDNRTELRDGIKLYQEDVIKIFQEKLKIEEDDKNGLIKISFTHQSPNVAFNIVSNLVKDVSGIIRDKDLQKINEQNDLLLNKLNQTTSKEIRDSLYSYYIENLKSSIFTTVNTEYVFSMIDKPSIPEKKSGPLRGLILILWTFGFVFFVLFIIIMLNIASEKK